MMRGSISLESLRILLLLCRARQKRGWLAIFHVARDASEIVSMSPPRGGSRGVPLTGFAPNLRVRPIKQWSAETNGRNATYPSSAEASRCRELRCAESSTLGQ
jgi:hypothetical protein